MSYKIDPITELLRNEEWVRYQNTHLITPDEAFDDIGTLIERIHDEEKFIPNIRIAPELDDSLDIWRIENGKKEGHWYSRSGSGPEDALVRRLVAMEAGYALGNGPVNGIIADCGMSAISLTLDYLARRIPMVKRKWKRFLVGKTLYFMTNDIVTSNMKEQGFEEAIYVDTTNPDEFKKVLNDNKDDIIGVFFETVSNPLIEITDTREIAQIAHEYGKPVIVDNTLLTPYGQQAFRLGADVVIHSLSKYLSGDGKTTGGVVIAQNDFIAGLKGFRSMRGGILSPESCKLVYERLPGFPDVMSKYTRNAQVLANYLKTVGYIDNVNYTDDHPNMRTGSGAVFSISFTGESLGEKQSYERKFVEELSRVNGPFQCKTSFGDGRYGALGQSTFGWDVPEKLKGVVRLSAGLSDVNLAVRQLHTVFANLYEGE